MYLKSTHPLYLCLTASLLLCTLACVPVSEPEPLVPPDNIVKVQVQKPKPGKETCYFNETPYFIGVDFKEGRIEVCPEKKIIFYPPKRCDPAFPHQVRWVVRCLDGSQRCMKDGDLVIIRPKDGRPGEDERERRRGCKMAEEVVNRRMCSNQKSPIDLPPVTKEERARSYEQRYTMFNPQSEGVFVIPHTARTAASGIPNPDFGDGISLGWYFNIELQRDGKTIACVDPDVWIERDKG